MFDMSGVYVSRERVKNVRICSGLTMAQKLSNQDRKELEKFTKFLALKAAQIIVQSRLGEKVSTSCKPQTSGADWFNLAVRDLPEVLAETKKAFSGEVVTACLPICVEISLRTVDGDQMVLESWCLGILSDQYDSNIKVMPTVYNRMGILLKSLVSVTRVTPAYKLSRRQGPDSYVICYRIYMDEPQLHTLGDGYKQVRVGQICTPIGTLQLTLSYRTKMTISPTQTGRDNCIMVKSDHFNTNLSPRHLRCKQNEENISLSETLKAGAFADPKKNHVEPELIIPNVQFSKLLTERLSPELNCEDNEVKKETFEDRNGNSPSDESRTSPSITMISTNDDFIMVDLKTPFATSMNTNNELSMFYREWQTAPPLKTFTEVPTLAEQDLAKQLETFESDMRTYDDVLKSLCQSPNNN